jgi:hypothetical protein
MKEAKRYQRPTRERLLNQTRPLSRRRPGIRSMRQIVNSIHWQTIACTLETLLELPVGLVN